MKRSIYYSKFFYVFAGLLMALGLLFLILSLTSDGKLFSIVIGYIFGGTLSALGFYGFLTVSNIKLYFDEKELIYINAFGKKRTVVFDKINSFLADSNYIKLNTDEKRINISRFLLRGEVDSFVKLCAKNIASNKNSDHIQMDVISRKCNELIVGILTTGFFTMMIVPIFTGTFNGQDIGLKSFADACFCFVVFAIFVGLGIWFILKFFFWKIHYNSFAFKYTNIWGITKEYSYDSILWIRYFCVGRERYVKIKTQNRSIVFETSHLNELRGNVEAFASNFPSDKWLPPKKNAALLTVLKILVPIAIIVRLLMKLQII